MSDIVETFKTDEYTDWLKQIKAKVAAARVKIALAANLELILFYYELGENIVRKQEKTKWGNKFIEQLSVDLKQEFPDMKGFSRTNLYYIKQFYQYFRYFPAEEIVQQSVGQIENAIVQQSVAQTENPIVQQSVGQIENTIVPQSGAQMKNTIIPRIGGQLPWGHIVVLISKVKDHKAAAFYINQTLENNWGRETLALQIKSNLYARQGKAVTNFQTTLPAPQSDLAEQTIKDPYRFDFLSMTQPYNERDIELQLCDHITKFLLELGKGFAFIGRQYHLEVGEKDYYLDLLFYHVKLKCYVVVELKNTQFKPEYTGKLNFYLSAVDSLVKGDDDNPTIGILLCRDKNNIEVEFALRDMNKPMGVSEFTLTEIVPEELKPSLPSIEEIEAEISAVEGGLK